MANTLHITITADSINPSKQGIIDAFARAFDPLPATISFWTKERGKVTVRVNRIAYESGVGHLLLIDGYFVAGMKGPFKGFYNTNEKSGHFTVG